MLKILLKPDPWQGDTAITHFRSQDYKIIKRACRDHKATFRDPLFPALKESINLSKRRLTAPVMWKRPHEICENPRFVIGDVNRLSATEGILGNSWFVTAISALASQPQLWNKVVPNLARQEFPQNPNDSTGVFHFTIFHFGKWMDVVIDDRLPTIDNTLVFTRSKRPNEFWCALLEKAYAKLYGSYKNLAKVNLADALVDFTGGFPEILHLNEYTEMSKGNGKRHLFKRIEKDLDSHHSLVCCSAEEMSPSQMLQRTTDTGLVAEHMYCVTALYEISVSRAKPDSTAKRSKKKIRMIRLRNPWGEKEWTGPFSFGSAEWRNLPDDEKGKMGLAVEDNGNFWMSFEEFCMYFTSLTVCHHIMGKQLYETSVRGKWEPDKNRAGGSDNGLASLKNPQFLLDIPGEASNTLMIMLQRKIPERRNAESIGLGILQVEQNREFILHSTRQQLGTSEYVQSQNVFHKCVIGPGRYIVIPATSQRGQEGSFMLRILSTNVCKLRALDTHVPSPPFWPWSKYLQTVTYLRVKQAFDLQQVDGKDPDTYCVVKWGKLKEVGKLVPKSTSPIWNYGIVVYKVKLSKPVIIEVWRKDDGNRHVLMGTATMNLVVNPKPKRHTLFLDDLKKSRSGQIRVTAFTTTDFMQL